MVNDLYISTSFEVTVMQLEVRYDITTRLYMYDSNKMHSFVRIMLVDALDVCRYDV